MEAVLFDGKTLTLQYVKNYPIPEVTGANDVIVKVAYSGVCGTDIHIIGGDLASIKSRPIPLGHESSGTVHAFGENVKDLKVGQKVVIDPNTGCGTCDYCRKGKYQYCVVEASNNTIGIWQDGGWAEYVKAPRKQIYAIPDYVTLEQAVLCEPYSCVAHGFNRASPLTIGTKILILGAGIIGNLWVTALHSQGHRDVTVSELNKSRLEIVKKLNTGYRLITPDQVANEGIEYDVIIDCTGVGIVLEKSLPHLKPGGKYVLFGSCPVDHKATINPSTVYKKELTIIGCRINAYTFSTAIGWLSALGDRYINYENLGIKIFKLSDYEKALSDLKVGKISKAVFKIE